MKYNAPMRCTKCGFVEVITVDVAGDFDGFEDHHLRRPSSRCPFCKHAKKLGIKVPHANKPKLP